MPIVKHSHTALDAELVLLAGTTDLVLAQSPLTVAITDLGETPVRGMSLLVSVPVAPTGTLPTLDVTITDSADVLIASMPQIITAGLFQMRWSDATTTSYKFVFTLTGTTANFGKVVAAIVPYAF